MDTVDEAFDPSRATGGRNEGADAVRESEEPNLVAANEGDMREKEHCVEGMIQGRESIAGIAGHQAAAVDQEDDSLALVKLKGAAGELASACGGTPVDVSGII